MVALGDESGMVDDHAPYPLPSLWVPVRCVPLVGIRPNVQIPTGTLPVPGEVDSGPPLRQAWEGLEIPHSCPVNSRLRFFSQTLNFVVGFGFPSGVPTDVRGRKTGRRVSP